MCDSVKTEDVWKCEPPTYFRKNSMLHVEQSLHSSLFNEPVLICLNEMTAKIELILLLYVDGISTL